MPNLPLDRVKPGMRLAKAAKNDSGMVLVTEGTELTESVIRRLAGMGVVSVCVAGDAKPARSPEELLEELDVRFRKCGDDPYMGMIVRIFREYIKGGGATT